MFTVERRVGRLIETRTSHLASLDEIAQFGARFREVVATLGELLGVEERARAAAFLAQ